MQHAGHIRRLRSMRPTFRQTAAAIARTAGLVLLATLLILVLLPAVLAAQAATAV